MRHASSQYYLGLLWSCCKTQVSYCLHCFHGVVLIKVKIKVITRTQIVLVCRKISSSPHSAQRSSLELVCQDLLLDYYVIVNLRWVFVTCLLNSANIFFSHCLVYDMIWYSRQSSWCGRSSPLINWRENKGGRHLLSRLFQTGRPPDAHIVLVFFFNFVTTVVGTLRYNLCCLNIAWLLQTWLEY